MRLVWVAVGVVVGAIAATKTLESRGVLRCCCPDSCWCHRSVLAALRWVVPIEHGSAVGREET